MKFPRPIIIIKTILAFFIVMLIICILSGCSERPGISYVHSTDTNQIAKVHDRNVEVIKIGDCEYFLCKNKYGHILSHKGDCSNPIHRFGLSNAERSESENKGSVPDGYSLVDQYTYNKNDMSYFVNVYRKQIKE